ncbi:MAG: PilZ domain-containing protein [Candidatus Omnitrophica bacterium]|nr:PilZ domain-containing protein [Candidatus Omnitrophota bacterium]
MMEKRKYPRYKANISIKYKRSDDPISSWQIGSEIKNISMGGLLFTAYENMPSGTPLIFKLHIFTKDKKKKIIELKLVKPKMA